MAGVTNETFKECELQVTALTFDQPTIGSYYYAHMRYVDSYRR